jgi:tetratricopeptide (TPR) repeat protein
MFGSGARAPRWAGGLVWPAGLLLLGLLLVAPASSQETEEGRIRAARLQAQAYAVLGQWEDAARVLQRLAELLPDDRYVLSDLANAQQRLGQVQAAVATYRTLLQRHPEAPQLADLAYLLAQEDQHAELVALLAHAPAAAGGPLRLLLAQALDRTGATTVADSLYNAMLGETPNDVNLLLTVASRYLDRQLTDQAQALLRRARAIAPDSPDVGRGLALAAQGGDPVEYRRRLNAAIALAPRDPELPYLLAESLRADQTEPAMDCYGECLLRLAQGDSVTAYQRVIRARALDRLGRAQEAEDSLRVLVIGPGEPPGARDALCELLLEQRRLAAADSLLATAPVRTAPTWLDAAVATRRGQWNRAVAVLTELAGRQPANTDLQLELADAERRDWRWQEALERLETVASRASRANRERALDLAREVRQSRAPSLGLAWDRTAMDGEDAVAWTPTLRWPVTRRVQAVATGATTGYQDNRLPWGGAYAGRGTAVTVGLEGALAPSVEGELQLTTYAGAGTQGARPGLAAAARWLPRRGGFIESAGGYGERWAEPVAVAVRAGRMHRSAVTVLYPVGRRLQLTCQGQVRVFHLVDDQWLGREERLALTVREELWRAAPGALLPLRAIGLSLAYERTWLARDPAAAVLAISLPQRSEAATLSLHARIAGVRAAPWEATFFVGRDPARELSLGEVHGFSLDSETPLGRHWLWRFGSFYASQTTTQTQGGWYWQARSSAIYYF